LNAKTPELRNRKSLPIAAQGLRKIKTFTLGSLTAQPKARCRFGNTTACRGRPRCRGEALSLRLAEFFRTAADVISTLARAYGAIASADCICAIWKVF
jgi:hypothetical protein